MKRHPYQILSCGIIILCLALFCTACGTKPEEQFVSPESDGTVGILERPELTNDMLTNNFVMVYDGYLLQLTPEEYSYILSGGEAQIRDANPDWDRMDALAYKFGPYTIENNVIVDDPFAPKSNYTFPPEDIVELQWALDKAGLNWSIQNDDAQPANIQPDPFAIHSITSGDGLVNTSINMRYYMPPDDRTASITFAYNEQTAEDILRFEQNDWPLIWQLAGILFECPQEIRALYQQWDADFEKEEKGVTGDSLIWNGKEGDVHCQVVFTWHPMLEMYVPDGIHLDNPLSHEAAADSAAYKYPVSADELNDMMSVYDWNWKADKDAYGANSYQGLVAGEPDVMFFTEIVPMVNDKIGLGFANMNCYSGSKLSDGSDERDLSINLAIQPFAATEEQLQAFCETDVPAVYALSGKLMADPDSVSLMENMAQEILPGLKYDGINTVSFLNHNNNAYCQSDYIWNETMGEYIFTSFTITKSEKYLARDMQTFASYFPFYDWTDTACTIQEMTAQASDGGTFLTTGTLVDIRPIDRYVYYSLADKGLVAGTAYEATLADETGEVKVRILPNMLSEEELSMELLHMVSCRIEDGTPVFTIEKSALPEAQLFL